MINYKLNEKTPENMECTVAACPAIYESESVSESYLVIGSLMNPKDFDLNEKVGKDEALIQIPKKLLEKIIEESNQKQ